MYPYLLGGPWHRKIFQRIWVESNLEMTTSLLLRCLRVLWRNNKVVDYFFRGRGLNLVRIINNLFDTFLAPKIGNAIRLATFSLRMIFSFETTWPNCDFLTLLQSSRANYSKFKPWCICWYSLYFWTESFVKNLLTLKEYWLQLLTLLYVFLLLIVVWFLRIISTSIAQGFAVIEAPRSPALSYKEFLIHYSRVIPMVTYPSATDTLHVLSVDLTDIFNIAIEIAQVVIAAYFL